MHTDNSFMVYRLLTGEQGFDNLLELAIQGDFRNCDMLVKDIYGSRDSEYTSLGLSSTLIASSFGKAISVDCSQPDKKVNAKIHWAMRFIQLIFTSRLRHGLRRGNVLVLFSTGFLGRVNGE